MADQQPLQRVTDEPHVLILGNLVEGFSVFGPASYDDCHAEGEEQDLTDYVVMRVYPFERPEDVDGS